MNIPTLDRVLLHCTVDGEHWIWKGAMNTTGIPVIHHDGKTTTVRRVVVEMREGRKLPKGWRAVSGCDVEHCVSPHCAARMTLAGQRRLAAERGAYSGNTLRHLRQSITRRQRSAVSDAAVRRMRESDAPSAEVAAAEGVRRGYVQDVRLGRLRPELATHWTRLGSLA